MQPSQKNINTYITPLDSFLSVHFPYYRVDFGSLGYQDEDNPIIYISLSLDPRHTWPHNIFQNSRHAHFSIDTNGNISKFGGSNTPKFRACKFKDLDNLKAKLLSWFEQSKNTTL